MNEEAAIKARLGADPRRLVVFIDVGKQTPQQQEATVKAWKEKLRKK